MEALGAGANDSIMPLLNTGVVIGFGMVVTQTEGFALFAHSVMTLDLPPLVSVAASISGISGDAGSASGGLDSLPHNVAVIAMLTNMGLKHAEVYRDIFVVTVLIPLLAALVAIALAIYWIFKARLTMKLVAGLFLMLLLVACAGDSGNEEREHLLKSHERVLDRAKDVRSKAEAAMEAQRRQIEEGNSNG